MSGEARHKINPDDSPALQRIKELRSNLQNEKFRVAEPPDGTPPEDWELSWDYPSFLLWIDGWDRALKEVQEELEKSSKGNGISQLAKAITKRF